MALTDMVIMPGADYQSMCDSIRALDGSTDVIKSGDYSGKVQAVSDTVDTQASLISQIETALEGKAGGGAEPEECTVTIYSQSSRTLKVFVPITGDVGYFNLTSGGSDTFTVPKNAMFLVQAQSGSPTISTPVGCKTRLITLLNTSYSGVFVAVTADGASLTIR